MVRLHAGRWLAGLTGAVLGLIVSSTAVAAQLHPALQNGDEQTRTVWVVFTDKATSRPGDREIKRTEAHRWVTPRARSRRAARGLMQSVVGERDLPLSAAYVNAVLATGAAKRIVSRWFNAVSVEATRGQIERIAALPFVRKIEPVAEARRDIKPPLAPGAPPLTAEPRRAINGVRYGRSYHQLDQINVLAAHAAGYDGSGVVIGIMDTGFYKGHQCLTSQTVLGERDFVFDDGDVEWDFDNPEDYSDRHGTSTWSAVGGFADGACVGAAFRASFLLAKTERSGVELAVEEDHWVAALEWLEANGADVVNSSLGFRYFDDATDYTFDDLDGNTAKVSIAADIATSLGVVVCTAIGNSGPSTGTLYAPSDARRIVACGAIDPSGNLAAFSSRGPTADGRIKPEVCARGLGVWVAENTRAQPTYDWRSGTSFASPLVAGAAALVVQAHPDWTALQVREALMATANRSASPANDCGWGIIDTMAAIEYGPARASQWERYF